jgi:hypothetical protein
MEPQKMDKKSKILITIFFVLLAVSVFMTYYLTLVLASNIQLSHQFGLFLLFYSRKIFIIKSS